MRSAAAALAVTATAVHGKRRQPALPKPPGFFQQHLVSCEPLPAAEAAKKAGTCYRRPHSKSERLIKHTNFIYTCICQGRLSDSYKLERELGFGSFGTVYLARHKLLGYERAVKKILKSPDDPMHVNLLMNEVHALMDLDHPNVVKLVRYYDEGDHLYLVFELCNGPDLFSRIADVVEAEGKMKEADAANILCQMLKALKCCHCHYMGHFDVKPENFMYSADDLTTLKMIDLGLSSGFKHDAQEIRGTAEYMAPEIWDGLYGPEGDVWSCGVVLFVMLTGCQFLPTKAKQSEFMEKVKDRAWIRQRLRWASKQGLSPQAMNLLTGMLRHDRHQRLTVREALLHPFLSSCNIEDQHPKDMVEKATAVLKELPADCQAFAAEPVLVRAALLLVAHIGGYAVKEAASQRLAFSIMDRNSDGELSMEAIEDYYLQKAGAIPDQLEAAIRGVDINDDGYITYLEFLSATLPPELRRSEAYFRVVFDLIDRSKDGCIDAADLAAAFRHGKDRDSICKLALREVSSNPDGLSWEEFRKLMFDESNHQHRRHH